MNNLITKIFITTYIQVQTVKVIHFNTRACVEMVNSSEYSWRITYMMYKLKLPRACVMSIYGIMLKIRSKFMHEFYNYVYSCVSLTGMP